MPLLKVPYCISSMRAKFFLYDESAKVFIQMSSIEGKDNVLNFLVVLEGYQPLDIAMSKGTIVNETH